jgi:hypothetical protein
MGRYSPGPNILQRKVSHRRGRPLSFSMDLRLISGPNENRLPPLTNTNSFRFRSRVVDRPIKQSINMSDLIAQIKAATGYSRERREFAAL